MSQGPILIVDDDADIRNLLCWLLEHRGYEVVCARSGQEALEMLGPGRVRPSLIVLDLMMPSMDGYAFRAAQKMLPGVSEVPVVVTSAIPNPRMGELEPADVVLKPLELDDLLPFVERHCGKRRAPGRA